MGFWSRGPKKTRPDVWIKTEARKLATEARGIESRAARQNGVPHPTSEAALTAAAPIYVALARLAGRTEAVKGLALNLRVQGSLDGGTLQTVMDLNDFVSSFYKDYQQSLGLLLFYPEVNGRLLPPNYTVEQFQQARAIGAEARGKFMVFWRQEWSKYTNVKNDAADAYATLMNRYAADTGRPASRFASDPIPMDMAPPPEPKSTEVDDSSQRSAEE